MASELGFHYPGRYFLDNVLYPKLEEAGVYVLDPFIACGEFLPTSVFNEEKSVKENTELWNRFNQVVGFINYRILIPRSQAIIAISEGGHLDDGVSAEVVYAVTRKPPIPVFAARSDFRKSENISGLNPANTWFMTEKFRSQLIEIPNAGRDTYDLLVKKVKEFSTEKADSFLRRYPEFAVELRKRQFQLVNARMNA